MSKVFTFLVTFLVSFLFIQTVSASTTYFDDFDDGILDGYTFINGNYWIEEGVLRQNLLGNAAIAFVDGQEYTDQIIEDDTKVDGIFCFSGFMFWFQDPGSSISVTIEPTFNRVLVIEKVNGVTTDYHYPVNLNDGQWYNLKVSADSATGEIDIYIDDVYLDTHYSLVEEKLGQTGMITRCNNLVSPPAGLFIDNFSITLPPLLTDKEQCKKGGWETFTNPSFRNQGACVSYVESNRTR